MHVTRMRLLVSALLCALALQACVPYVSSPGDPGPLADPNAPRHLVLFSSEQVPADFGQRVASLGGSVEIALDEIGMATVTGLSQAAATELAGAPGVRSVEADPLIPGKADRSASSSSSAKTLESEAAAVAAEATGLPSGARFYSRQWNMRAVLADKAWEAGHLGSRDVVVAIVDTGIDYEHPDLAGLVDLERSKSFVPKEEEDVEAFYPGRLPFTDLFWHGTASAALVASNANVLAGVNQNTTLLAVKVANQFDTGSVGRLIAGIVYAAKMGADVIETGRGFDIDKRKDPGTAIAFELAALYALAKGALIVAISFNDATDLDNNGDIVLYPCEAFGVICVSATGPTSAPEAPGGFNGPWENVDARATRPDPVNPLIGVPYSGFGAAVDVAAPGGSLVANPNAPPPFLPTIVWLPCTSTPTTNSPMNCLPTSTVPILERVQQGVGTSWAAPHVAGLAALLVAQLGHDRPLLIRDRILRSVDDLGEPGDDPYYGKGRINVARALGLVN